MYECKCSSCPHSICGSRNGLSDICDSCTCDPITGFGGFTDHSLSDENNHSPVFLTEQDYIDLCQSFGGEE